MKRIFFLLFFSLFIVIGLWWAKPTLLFAAQSTITESEGYACMGEDKSRKQAEQTAMTDAKRKAVENVMSYIKSETKVKDFQLEKDVIEAYANASVKIIQEIEKGWYKDATMGDCFKIKIKAEIVPDEKAMEKASKSAADDPSAPLNVNVWTGKKEYKNSEKIKVYIKGNKPFYARVVYKDAGGQLVQLLPNPYRGNNYFNGGVIYEIPSGEDRFELEVSPPFGSEGIIVYASSSQVGEIDLKASGGVYEIKTKAKDIGDKTRGVVITEKGGEKKEPSEFSEATVDVKTGEK
ncbi:MAG TPA: DUF4384 domain-containing protein [Thermodesulfobacteriota bacterium]|nr:DUF4384 domain-containing protein [Thermodesulfobacteriota bacterium]